ncbi:MAG: hypothetical protein KAX20_03805, partial [Candidatus Omnitrophica bacterium]|nr:hypothetical protein [Candidatus Omnitrophota bacterium]
MNIEELKKICLEVRKDIIRMLGEAGSGHPGGSLSAVELVVALYFSVMRHRAKEPDWEERDRFILSKGHCCPLLYAVLAKCGYFPAEKLLTLRKLKSPLQGHPHNLEVPGIEASTGSLGQGLSIANGIALAGKLDKIFCGDSEELLRGFPDNCVDIIVTSPPYNFGLDYSADGTKDAVYWQD